MLQALLGYDIVSMVSTAWMGRTGVEFSLASPKERHSDITRTTRFLSLDFEYDVKVLNGVMYKSFQALCRVLEDVSAIYEKLQTNELWWRGQSDQSWQLKPRVYRRPRSLDPMEARRYEFNLVWEFEQQAPIRYPGWPSDKCKQLMLMQHYGLPKRLLDWTRSLLTGLYFAVCNSTKDSCDASLWALNPKRLNSSQGRHGVLHDEAKDAQWLVREAFESPTEPVVSVGYAFAMTGPQVDLRMLVQSAAFTIHGAQCCHRGPG